MRRTLMAMLCTLLNGGLCAVMQGAATMQGGPFQMGIDDMEGRHGESPSYNSAVKPFQFDKYPVTNAMFMQFMDAKRKFKTDAENRGWSMVFEPYVVEEDISKRDHEPTESEPWMVPIRGADWRHPLGPSSSIDDKLDHPVVHVTKRDAQAYCKWVGKRLPTEFEWEYAARGGQKGLEFPWGDSYEIGRTNLWQGPFPEHDSGRDGYAGTSPVNAFQPHNLYAIYDLIGNVWEWTTTPWHLRHNDAGKPHHLTVKGGSHLDSRRGHVGQKARVASRSYRHVHFSASNVGFRCAKTLPYETAAQKAQRTPFWIHSEL